MILMALMEKEGYILSESELYKEVEDMENEMIKLGSDDNYINRFIQKDAKESIVRY